MPACQRVMCISIILLSWLSSTNSCSTRTARPPTHRPQISLVLLPVCPCIIVDTADVDNAVDFITSGVQSLLSGAKSSSSSASSNTSTALSFSSSVLCREFSCCSSEVQRNELHTVVRQGYTQTCHIKPASGWNAVQKEVDKALESIAAYITQQKAQHWSLIHYRQTAKSNKKQNGFTLKLCLAIEQWLARTYQHVVCWFICASGAAKVAGLPPNVSKPFLTHFAVRADGSKLVHLHLLSRLLEPNYCVCDVLVIPVACSTLLR